MSDTVKAIVGSLVADGIALAVAFGVNISSSQQAAILAFVGSVTTAATVVVGWIETHKIRQATTLASRPVYASAGNAGTGNASTGTVTLSTVEGPSGPKPAA